LKKHLKILKTTSSSFSKTDLSNVMTFSPSQSNVTVPLKTTLLREKFMDLFSLDILALDVTMSTSEKQKL
jgi:hypothetical protein